MKTIENNKLIAEFLSVKIHPCETIEKFKFLPIEERGLYNGYFIDELKYHEDWNWLMQLVEKIESLGYNIDTMKVDITKYQSSQFCGIYIDGKRIYTNYCETKIEAVYNACVEFIKWYNEQNKVS